MVFSDFGDVVFHSLRSVSLFSLSLPLSRSLLHCVSHTLFISLRALLLYTYVCIYSSIQEALGKARIPIFHNLSLPLPFTAEHDAPQQKWQHLPNPLSLSLSLSFTFPLFYTLSRIGFLCKRCRSWIRTRAIGCLWRL